MKNINHFNLILFLLGVIAIFSLFRDWLPWLFSTNSQLIINSEVQSPVVALPVYYTESKLEGVQALLETRKSQLDILNSSQSFKAISNGAAFSAADEQLPWFDTDDEKDLLESVYDQSTKIGLLNPLILLIPHFGLTEVKNLVIADSLSLFKFSKLTFDAANKEATLTVQLSPLLSNNNYDRLKKVNISTSNFNAFDLGIKYSQLDKNKSRNVEFKSKTETANPIFSVFSAQPCKISEVQNSMAQKCNRIIFSMGTDSFVIQALPAVASFKLWSEQPNPESPALLNYNIQFELAAF